MSVVTLSVQNNAKLLQKLTTGFKRIINWNKYQSKPTLQTRKRYLNYLTDPSFQGVNWLFVFSFENDVYQKSYRKYFLATVKIEEYNVITDGKNFFDHPIKNYLRTYEDIQKIATGQGDDKITSCLLNYNCFKDCYKTTAINLSKQQALDADPKPLIWMRRFRSRRTYGNACHHWKSKRTRFRFFTRNCESAAVLFCFNIIIK